MYRFIDTVNLKSINLVYLLTSIIYVIIIFKIRGALYEKTNEKIFVDCFDYNNFI